MCEFGGVMAFNAWLMLKSKTLGLRMRQHETNAMNCRVLEAHPKVAQVVYQAGPVCRSRTGRRQMDGFGAMISFEVMGGLKAAKKMASRLRLAKLAVSLGDCETLIELPAAMTHARYPKERLQEFGLSDSMLRLSVGIENARDIINDLDQALSS